MKLIPTQENQGKEQDINMRSANSLMPKNRFKRNFLLNLITLLCLFIFLFWAEGDMYRFLGSPSWLPEAMNGYSIQILNLFAVYAILALSLNLIYGFTGMFSLGHAGFMAIGAYISALCVLSPESKEIMWILDPIAWPFSVIQTSFITSLFLGGLGAALIAFCIALPVLRLGDDYLGIATLGFAEIIRVLILNFTTYTNGPLGIKGIPQHTSLYFTFLCFIIVLFFLTRLLNSNYGNVFKAIRDNEIAARVMGVNVFKYKLLSFCMGAFLAGVGGALLGNLLTTIDPKMFNFQLTFNILMIVVAGGLGSLSGSILGALIITVLLEWLRFIEAPMDLVFFEVPGIPGMRMVVFSVILLLIILYRREGIMGMNEITWDRIFSFFSWLKSDKKTKKAQEEGE